MADKNKSKSGYYTGRKPGPDPSRKLPEDRESIRKKLEEYAAVDIKTVDPSTLTDITDYKIDTSLPPAERVKKFIEDCGNPYVFITHGTIVKTSFAGHGTLEDALKRCIRKGPEL